MEYVGDFINNVNCKLWYKWHADPSYHTSSLDIPGSRIW